MLSWETYSSLLDMESRNRFVFCETCVDFVYDHGLERLCGPSGKFEYQGKPRALPNHFRSTRLSG